jgi:hypothetical protein
MFTFLSYSTYKHPPNYANEQPHRSSLEFLKMATTIRNQNCSHSLRGVKPHNTTSTTCIFFTDGPSSHRSCWLAARKEDRCSYGPHTECCVYSNHVPADRISYTDKKLTTCHVMQHIDTAHWWCLWTKSGTLDSRFNSSTIRIRITAESSSCCGNSQSRDTKNS